MSDKSDLVSDLPVPARTPVFAGRRSARAAALLLAPVLGLAACSGEPAAPDPDDGRWWTDAPMQDAVVYPLTANPYTTLQMIWAPKPIPEETEAAIADRSLTVTDTALFASYGLGVQREEGEPWIEQAELAPGWAEFATGGTASPRSVFWMWQAADPQLIDNESPIRFAGVYALVFGSTYRPQEHLTTQVFESHVRTGRRLSELAGRPFELAFVAGDLTDGGQENEVDWFITIMAGGIVNPDSGANDDPVPGPGNDFSDPFVSDGIGVPWVAAIGNHETLYMGTFEPTDEVQAAAVGDEVFNGVRAALGLRDAEGVRGGFRDGSRPDAPIVTSGRTPPDPARRILPQQELLQRLYEAPGEPAGHGLSVEDVEADRGYFSFYPLGADRPLRFIVLNTIQRDPPSSLGRVDEVQFAWLEAELAAAAAAGELVIVGSHHRSGDFYEASPIQPGAFVAALGRHGNVVLHLTGHGHRNLATRIGRVEDGPEVKHSYWELMQASTVDFPMQSRAIELVYNGGGYLSIYLTNIDHNAPEDSMAHEARHLSAARRFFQGNEYREFWEAGKIDRNLLLQVQLPVTYATSLESHDWPTRIESTATLATLTGP